MTVLDQQLPDRITAEMSNVQAGRWLVTVIAALFYALGFVVARVVRVTMFVAMWVFTAVRLGWREGLAKTTPRIN